MKNKKQIKNEKMKQYKSTGIFYKPWRTHKNEGDYFDQVFIQDRNFKPAEVKRPKLEGIKNNEDIAFRKSLPIVKEYHLKKSEKEKVKKLKASTEIMIGDILTEYFKDLGENVKADEKGEKTTARRASRTKSSNLSYSELLNDFFGNISIRESGLKKKFDDYVNGRRSGKLCRRKGLPKPAKDGSIGQELQKVATAVSAKLNDWNLDVDEIIKHKDDVIYLMCVKSIINHVKETKGLYSNALKEPIDYNEYLCTIKHITNDKSIDNIFDKVFTYLFWTGARCGELFELTWDMIDFEDKKITLPEALVKESKGKKKKKGGKTKQFSTVKEVWLMLERLKQKATKEIISFGKDDEYIRTEKEPAGTDLVFVNKDGNSIEGGYLYAWNKIRTACNIVYSENKKQYKRARNFRNAYVDMAREAEHNGSKGSMQATGHSKKTEEYYATKWKSHLHFIELLEDWKATQEKVCGEPDRNKKHSLADVVNSDKFA